MQREREGRDPFDDPFFGSRGSMMSSIFGGRDPFDNPFFTRPFGSIFDSSRPTDSVHVSRSREPIIEELNSDEEREVEEEEEEEEKEDASDTGTRSMKDKSLKSKKSSKDPLVEHPDDQDNGEKSRALQHRSNYNGVEGTRPQSHSVSFRKVTYGGIDGAYYTATTTRKAGGDGVVLEESKQADITTGQAAHRISKGIHDKGHTVTRKLDADGRVDTMQTLHNLNEDELASFERDWKGNVERHLPGWNETSSSANAGASGSGQSRRPATGGWALPISEFLGRGGGMRRDSEAGAYSSGGRAKKVVRINID